MHGYTDVNDYWSRASSEPFLSSIKTPTMIIHAENDPFLPGNKLKTLTQNNGNIMLNLTTQGGACWIYQRSLSRTHRLAAKANYEIL
jgi:predicted alpha/beta-fold hydrolase